MKGSRGISQDIRAAAVTYQRVTALLPEGAYLLSCGHEGQDNEANPSYLDQFRYCHTCTHNKLRETGDAQ